MCAYMHLCIHIYTNNVNVSEKYLLKMYISIEFLTEYLLMIFSYPKERFKNIFHSAHNLHFIHYFHGI